MQFALRQRHLAEGSRPSFCAGRKLGAGEQALLWTLLHEDPACPSRVLRDQVATLQSPIAVRMRHRNRWRAPWQRHRPTGRPRQGPCRQPVALGAEVVQVTPRRSFVGVPRFAPGLDPHEGFGPVVVQLTPAIEVHKRPPPDEDFALWQHRAQTLRRRCQALFFAPLLGIEPLTAFAPHAHPLPTLLGRGDHRATLGPFLGQRERSEAAEALRPTLVPQQVGQIAYVDGHMSASGRRVSMHQGKSTMLGRLLAGSQAVITHDETGQALFGAAYPPASPLAQGMVGSGQKVAMAPGTAGFGIDRAGNAVAMARGFDHQGFGRLCLLDDHEHHGRESFEATLEATLKDGPQVSSGPWQMPRAEDPRYCVIGEPAEGKPWVSWGTPQVKAALEPTAWPHVDRERSERQDNSFKRMLDHGALHTNYGRQKSVAPDRPQQRQK
jgi:hypothetical protein